MGFSRLWSGPKWPGARRVHQIRISWQARRKDTIQNSRMSRRHGLVLVEVRIRVCRDGRMAERRRYSLQIRARGERYRSERVAQVVETDCHLRSLCQLPEVPRKLIWLPRRSVSAIEYWSALVGG